MKKPSVTHPNLAATKPKVKACSAGESSKRANSNKRLCKATSGVDNIFAKHLNFSSCAVSAEERLRIDFKQECGYNGYEIERENTVIHAGLFITFFEEIPHYSFNAY